MSMTDQSKRKRGRPRGGALGTRVRDFPALLVRLPPQIHDIVTAVAKVKGWSQARVITEALVVYRLSYLRAQEPAASKQVDELLDSRRLGTQATSAGAGEESV